MTYGRRAFLRLAGGGSARQAMASTASAHAIILASVPGAGEISTSPPYLVLRFNGRIEKHLSSVTLVGPNDATIPLLDRKSAHADILGYRLPLLNPGQYQAKWKVLSADGHITEGVVTFTVVTSPAPQ